MISVVIAQFIIVLLFTPCSNFGFRTWKIQECPNNYVEWLICDTSVLYSYRSLSQILVNYCSTFLKSEFFYDSQLLPLWNEWILEPRSVKVTLLQSSTWHIQPIQSLCKNMLWNDLRGWNFCEANENYWRCHKYFIHSRCGIYLQSLNLWLLWLPSIFWDLLIFVILTNN